MQHSDALINEVTHDFLFLFSHDRTMQDIVYKLVPGLQEGKCIVFLMHPPKEKYLLIKTFLMSLLGVMKQVVVHSDIIMHTIESEMGSDCGDLEK